MAFFLILSFYTVLSYVIIYCVLGGLNAKRSRIIKMFADRKTGVRWFFFPRRIPINSGLKACLILLLMTASCSPEPRGQQGKSSSGGGGQEPQDTASVMVAVAAPKTVPVEIRAIGMVEALKTVEVRAQVGGLLTGAHFSEGRPVDQDGLLFTIDQRPYEIAVKQITAVLARDMAQEELARKEAERSKVLFEKRVVSQEDYDRDRAAAEAQAAAVRADRANLENARLELSYCEIRAPISGVAGKRLVDPGNLVRPNDPALVVINQLQPIHVGFSVPEDRLAEIKKYMSAGALEVKAYLPGEPEVEKGELNFVDNAVDRTTGTILLRAVFPNQAQRLWPGQYVDVTLTLATLSDALVVPTSAIQTGQLGQYVFVVKDDQTVEIKPVTTGLVYGEETVIEQGISAGLQVVTDGHLRLTAGSRVTIKSGLLEPAKEKP